MAPLLADRVAHVVNRNPAQQMSPDPVRSPALGSGPHGVPGLAVEHTAMPVLTDHIHLAKIPGDADVGGDAYVGFAPLLYRSPTLHTVVRKKGLPFWLEGPSA